MRDTTVISTGPSLDELHRRLSEASGRFQRERMPVSEAQLYDAGKRDRWRAETGYSYTDCRMMKTAFRRRDPDGLPTEIRAFYLTLDDAEIMNEIGRATASDDNPTALHDSVIRWRMEGRAVIEALTDAG